MKAGEASETKKLIYMEDNDHHGNVDFSLFALRLHLHHSYDA